MAQQINVRLHGSEYDMLRDRAAEWGVSPTEYARLQMLAPPSDWGMRRMEMPEDVLRAPSANVDRDVAAIMQGEGFELLDSGWWKNARDSRWVKVIPRG